MRYKLALKSSLAGFFSPANAGVPVCTSLLLHRAKRLASTICVLSVWAAAPIPVEAQLSLLLDSGDTAPLEGAVFKRFRDPVAADSLAGTAAYVARIKGGDARSGIFFGGVQSGVSAVATDAAGGSGPAAFRRFNTPSVEPDGDLVWYSNVSGEPGGLFRGDGQGTVDRVLRVGVTIPSAPGTISQIGSAVTATEDNDVLFHAKVADGPDVGGVLLTAGILRCGGGDGLCETGGSGSLTEVVITNASVDDRPGRKVCTIGSNFSASSFGVVFRALTRVDCSNGAEEPLEGFFRKAFGGQIETIALVGEPTDQAEFPGASFGRLNGGASISSDGTVAFTARLTNPNTYALFRCDPADSCPTVVPATPFLRAGDFDSDENRMGRFASPRVSDAGDIVFRCVAKGPTLRGSSIFAYRKQTDQIERLAGRGELFLGRVLTKVGRPSVSPGGRVVFRAKTRDGGNKNRQTLFLYE